jgi:proline dehydrogenase
MGIFDKTVASSLKFIPKPIVRKVASRYIAGETLDAAVTETKRLNELGCMTTIDLLGEAIQNEEEANASADVYLQVLDAIAEHGLDANASIKPTHFGLELSVDIFERNVRRVVEKAASLNNFVRIDMEDSPYTDDTLAVYRRLRADGFDNCGTVLQAMLRRTMDDLVGLGELAHLRLCKGIYREPEDVAFQSYDEVNAAFVELLEYALPRKECYVGVATHDDPVIEAAERIIEQHGLAREDYEFQMLLGVRPEVRRGLVERGHRVRIYTPFGTSWYAYCVRRLKENPKFAGYVTADVLKNPGMLFGDGTDKR